MPDNWLGQPTESLYERADERIYEAVLESVFEDDGKPSRDALAFCGTAVLVAGTVIATAFGSWIGPVMAVAGTLVFCTAWAKRND